MKVVRPKRVKRTYTQRLVAPPAGVFPLLCPAGETEWAPGGQPAPAGPKTGSAAGNGTPAATAGRVDAVWIVTRYDAPAHELTMYKVIPGHTVGRLDIALEGDGKGRTAAEVSYEYTSLGPGGDSFLESFTEEWYQSFMSGWEVALNDFLRAGGKIDA